MSAADRDIGACDDCVRRSWLLARLAGHLDQVRGRIASVLELSDEDLIAAVGGARREQLRSELASFDRVEARQRTLSAGLEAICRCNPRYPWRLTALSGCPAVLHVAGGLTRFLDLVAEQPVALVGARKATPYGLDAARALGRGLGAAGVTVLSGMAVGIDTAAHAGALDAGAGTVAVLPGGADRPYPAARRALHRRILLAGASVSELPPGVPVRRWTFTARNRIIAALAAMTVVIEAGEHSGALLTARFAEGLGRLVSAVPGRITTPQAAGPNGLLAAGAGVIRGPQDVLDLLYGTGVRTAPAEGGAEVDPQLRPLLRAIAEGHDTAKALACAGLSAEQGLAALAALELSGHVRRAAGGRFSVVC